MVTSDYEHFCTVARDRSGMVVGADKRYLVDSRLLPIAHAESLNTVDELLAKIRAAANETLIRRCIEAIATHETSFFRDHTPFDQLSQVILPHILEKNARKRSFRIWSAACSTGQEPYSIAMTLYQHSAKLSGWTHEIIATDLTEDAVVPARSGRYTKFEIQRGLTPSQIDTNFHKINDDCYEILPHFREHIKFKAFNLLDSYATLGSFDLVFCRNVLIYFNRAMKTEILDKIAGTLGPDGLLVLGSAETVVGLSQRFAAVPGARGIYKLEPVGVPA